LISAGAVSADDPKMPAFAVLAPSAVQQAPRALSNKRRKRPSFSAHLIKYPFDQREDLNLSPKAYQEGRF
jgi:hypothetical protein